MWVWTWVASRTGEVATLKLYTAYLRYSSQRSWRRGRPSRIAGSSTWITLIPACSRSTTSSRIASASCSHVSARGWSSRTNDHWSIVTGPVSIPLIGLPVSDWAYRVHSTVIGSGRFTSPNSTGGRTYREPYDCTHAFSVNA